MYLYTKTKKVETEKKENKGLVDTLKTPSPDSGNGKKKRRFKMPTSMTIIMIVIVFVMILTWAFNGRFAGVDPNTGEDLFVTPIGLFAFGTAFIGGFAEAAPVILYLFVLGAFIEVMLRSGALEAGVNSLIRKVGNKVLLLIPILFTLFAFGGTTYGMQEETIGLFIIIVPFLILAGFDSMTGLLVVVLGSCTGFMVSTVNPFTIGSAVDALPGVWGDAGFGIGIGLGTRFLIWFMAVAIGASLVTLYAWRVFKDPTKSALSEQENAENLKWAKENMASVDVNKKMTKKQKWGLIIFGSSFVLMIIMFLPWPDIIGYDPEQLPWLAWLFAGSNFGVPGWWYFGELIILFSISTIACAMIFGMKGKQASEAMWDGAKGMLSVSILIGLARSISVIMDASSLGSFAINSMASGAAGLGSTGFTYLMFFMFLVFAMLIPSTSGLASASMPIVGGLVATSFNLDPSLGQAGNVEAFSVMSTTILVFSMALGIINMFIPTQAVVMASADLSRTPYPKMLKVVGIYVGVMIVFTCAVVPLSLMMG